MSLAWGRGSRVSRFIGQPDASPQPWRSSFCSKPLLAWPLFLLVPSSFPQGPPLWGTPPPTPHSSEESPGGRGPYSSSHTPGSFLLPREALFCPFLAWGSSPLASAVPGASLCPPESGDPRAPKSHSLPPSFTQSTVCQAWCVLVPRAAGVLALLVPLPQARHTAILSPSGAPTPDPS